MPKKGYVQPKSQRLKISKKLKGREFTKQHCRSLSKNSFWKGRSRQESFKLLKGNNGWHKEMTGTKVVK